MKKLEEILNLPESKKIVKEEEQKKTKAELNSKHFQPQNLTSYKI